MNEAQLKNSAKVLSIVQEYRLAKATREIFDERLKKWRGMLKNLLPVLGGKWQDELGYARIEEYKETYSYDKAGVDDVIDHLEENAAALDDDSGTQVHSAVGRILRNYAAMLRQARRPRKGYTTVKVK